MAQMTAPESIVRAILKAGPSPERKRLLAALGLAEDGSPCSDGERATALAELMPDPAADAPEPSIFDEVLPF
jgi:hypothetical protein